MGHIQFLSSLMEKTSEMSDDEEEDRISYLEYVPKELYGGEKRK